MSWFIVGIVTSSSNTTIARGDGAAGAMSLRTEFLATPPHKGAEPKA